MPAYASALDTWLSARPDGLVGATSPLANTDSYMAATRSLMHDLYSSGWSRYGWPEEVGGFGGSILHRAAMWELLARHGVRGMAAFEHLEVLGPTLLALGPSEFVSEVFPRFLDGTQTWAQGFSEPDSGSDLGGLRTRAVPSAGGYTLTGRKIWTSWARFARWCLVLARTGPTESRHRGITALMVDMTAPGVDVRSISQSNGHDELAEVTFDAVEVPGGRILGDADGGWKVAMHVLGHERGTFAWFRQCFLQQTLLDSLPWSEPAADGLLSEAILDLASVRAMSLAALRAEHHGALLGPRAAFTKLLLCDAEKSLYDWVLGTDPDLAVDPFDGAALERRAGYLFSRIVTVYGGSQQMQLDTIAKQVLKLPT